MEKHADRLRRYLILLLVLTLLMPRGSVWAENNSQETASADTASSVSTSIAMEPGSAEEYTEITATYRDGIAGGMCDLPINYSDEFFSRDENMFYMDLARASFGMTVSAFRGWTKKEGARQDAHIRSFFAQAGFENYESTGYETKPTGDSFSNAIAMKKIGGFTLVAFIGCGEGYADEWLGNLTVGNGTEHEGFSYAASLGEQRLHDYLKRYGITGDVRLWISGFSRASAVDNCLAAHMMESGLFTKIFGYFFATPNNTKSPVAYTNLFNIIGQNDLVPFVPLMVWDYGRNGIDLYTPAQETNSCYIAKALYADEVAEAITGQSFHNNPDLNRQLRVVFEYLSTIFTKSEDYVAVLQPQLLSVWRQHSGSDLLVVLREAMSNVRVLEPTRRQAVNAIINYLDQVIYTYVSGNDYQKKDGSWNDLDSLSANVVLEHQPSTYAVWLFSQDDPADLFDSYTETTRVVIRGSYIDVEIWDDYGIVQSVDSQNEEVVYVPGSDSRPEDAPLVYLYASDHDGKIVINLPHDAAYSVRLKFLRGDTVAMFCDDYVYGSGEMNDSDMIMFSAEPGDTVILSDFTSEDGIQISDQEGNTYTVIRQDLSDDTLGILAREQLMNKGHTMGQILAVAAAVILVPALMLLVALAISFFGRKRIPAMAKTAITICMTLVTLILGSGAVFFSVVLPNMHIIPAGLAAFACMFPAINTLRYRDRKTAGISCLLMLCAFCNYLFFSRKRIILHAVILGMLILAEIALTIFTVIKYRKRNAAALAAGSGREFFH